MSTAKLISVPSIYPARKPSMADDDEIPPDLRKHTHQTSIRTDVLIVAENPGDWRTIFPDERIISAFDYLAPTSHYLQAGTTILNLCRSYKYLSVGYYCSLLAEARGQVALPSVKTINDLSRKSIYQLDTVDLNETVNSFVTAQASSALPVEFSIDIVCGLTDYQPLAKLATEIFHAFPAPFLRVEFARAEEWHIQAIKLQHSSSISHSQHNLLQEINPFLHCLQATGCPSEKSYQYKLAVLHNPHEVLAPSNPRALEKFVTIGKELGIKVKLIEKKDYANLCNFDALLIRETTAINHHTYLFAKKAENEGIVVIDDSNSILRCTNKVYLSDLLRIHNIPTPRTLLLQHSDLNDIASIEAEIQYPMVMKIPDGAFCRGVSKVSRREDFVRSAQELLKHSSLILVQEYLFTDFDWRIGVLNNQVIFASQYFMSKDHWQVAKRDANGNAEFGMARSVPLVQVPPQILDYAVRAANLIGNSLYGVDMKMTERGPVVIEVNDNPNLDFGIEDSVLGDELYRIILREMLRRIELQKRGLSADTTALKA